MKDKNILNFDWFIVSFSFITLALVFAVWYSFSVFFVALLKEFGSSRSIGAGAFSLFVMFSVIAAPFAGGLVDRFGPKGVILLGSLLLGAGLALCSFIQTWWQFYIFFSFITGVGVGAAGWVPNVTLIQLFFKEKRGLAIGIVSSGIGIGILVCVPTVQYLVTRIGWRLTYRVMAIFIPLIIIFIAVMFLRRPLQTSESAHNKKGISPTLMNGPMVVNREWALTPWSVPRAIANKTFWLLCLSFFLGSFMTISITTHHVAFFVDRGLDALFASYIVGFVGIVSVGSKILWGVLSDKIGREVTYTIGIICSIFGIMSLIAFDISLSSGLPYVYALFFGMGYPVTVALPPLITADIFEGQAYGRIFGALMFFMGVGGASGAWLGGFLHDQAGSYLLHFIILIACAFFSCLSIWWAASKKISDVPQKSMALFFDEKKTLQNDCVYFTQHELHRYGSE